MKIISKFKDYYDYKVAEYGTDENLVYDRRLPAGVGIGSPQRSWITLENASDDEALHSALYVGTALVHLLPHALKYTPIGILPTLRIGITAYMICGMATAMC